MKHKKKLKKLQVKNIRCNRPNYIQNNTNYVESLIKNKKLNILFN
jgi:hypothetical protein